MPAFLYPFDPVGNLPSNLITGEQHVLSPANNIQYHFIIPKKGPFYADSLVITRTVGGTTTPLVIKTDYLLVYPFIGATRAITKPVYGGIGFTNTSLSGVITVKYQTIGGEWVLDESAILVIAANSTYNPRITSWEEVSGTPEVFPPVPHDWNLVDMVGELDILNKLEEIRQALITVAGSDVTAHLGNFNNPHHVTQSQVGLSNLLNYGVADLTAANAGAADKYITAYVLKEFVTNALSGINMQKASAAEVMAGTDDLKYVTALGIASALQTFLADYQKKLKNESGVYLAMDALVQTPLLNESGLTLPGGTTMSRRLRNQDNSVLPMDAKVQEALLTGAGFTLPANTKVQLAIKDMAGNWLPAGANVPLVNTTTGAGLISPDGGNLLQYRPNGVYYGITAPPNLGNLYVDAVLGNDSNQGNLISAPLKTLVAAINKAIPGTNRIIRIKEGQTHVMTTGGNVVAGKLVIQPYGPGLDAIILAAGNNNNVMWTEDVLNLNTKISSGNLIDYAPFSTRISNLLGMDSNAEIRIDSIALVAPTNTGNTNGWPVDNNLSAFFLPNEAKNYSIYLWNCDFQGLAPSGNSRLVVIQTGNSGTVVLQECKWTGPIGTTFSYSDDKWKIFTQYNNNTTFLFNASTRPGYMTAAMLPKLMPTPTKQTTPITSMNTNISPSLWP